MVYMQGPDVHQIASKPLIEVADSKKHEDGVSIKLAGTNGSTEFEAHEVVTIIRYLTDFALAKNLDLNTRGNLLVADQAFLSN